MSQVFIASSMEGKQYAELIARAIATHAAQALLWWSPRAFPLGVTLVESLFKLCELVDSAVVILTEDDKTVRRGEHVVSPAQNLLLEYGLLAGRLGRRNVAVVRVGAPQMPSDLDGVVHIRLPVLQSDDDADLYLSVHVVPALAQWLHEMDAASSDALRLSRLVQRLMPDASPEQRIRVKTEILAEQINPYNFPRLTSEDLEHLLLKYAYRPQTARQVGFSVTTPVRNYVDLTDVPPNSEDESALAGHLARYVADLVQEKTLRPTVIAISKLASQGVLRAAAARLPMPLIMVSPYGPNRDVPIEGHFELGDRAILLHDVALSGKHLVDCLMTLRSHGLMADDLVALTQHQGGGLRELMTENRVRIHSASMLLAERGRVICGNPSIGDSEPTTPACVLCDVVLERDDVPARLLLSRADLPSEILYQTPSFVVVADVAPLAPGHVLVVSRRHLIAMSKAEQPQLAELAELYERLVDHLRSHYGRNVVAFEHGLCNRLRMSSCGIDHAHLHMLPFEHSLATTMRRDHVVVELDSIGELPAAVSERDEYLLLLEARGTILLGFAEAPTRQYFRRVISDLNGRDLWNWSDEVLLRGNREARAWILKLHEQF